MTLEVARFGLTETAGVDKDGGYCRGGLCRSGQSRRKSQEVDNDGVDYIELN